MSVARLWWAYLHTNGTVQLKRFVPGGTDIAYDSRSPYVKKTCGPFEASDYESAMLEARSRLISAPPAEGEEKYPDALKRLWPGSPPAEGEGAGVAEKCCECERPAELFCARCARQICENCGEHRDESYCPECWEYAVLEHDEGDMFDA